jgi:hypothetical protein
MFVGTQNESLLKVNDGPLEIIQIIGPQGGINRLIAIGGDPQLGSTLTTGR